MWLKRLVTALQLAGAEGQFGIGGMKTPISTQMPKTKMAEIKVRSSNLAALSSSDASVFASDSPRPLKLE